MHAVVLITNKHLNGHKKQSRAGNEIETRNSSRPIIYRAPLLHQIQIDSSITYSWLLICTAANIETEYWMCTRYATSSVIFIDTTVIWNIILLKPPYSNASNKMAMIRQYCSNPASKVNGTTDQTKFVIVLNYGFVSWIKIAQASQRYCRSEQPDW